MGAKSHPCKLNYTSGAVKLSTPVGEVVYRPISSGYILESNDESKQVRNWYLFIHTHGTGESSYYVKIVFCPICGEEL